MSRHRQNGDTQAPKGSQATTPYLAATVVPTAEYNALLARVGILEQQLTELRQERKVAEDQKLLRIRELERMPELRVRRPALMAAFRNGTLPGETRPHGKKSHYLFRYADVRRRFCPDDDRVAPKTSSTKAHRKKRRVESQPGWSRDEKSPAALDQICEKSQPPAA